MSLNFRDDLVKASQKQFEAQIEKHRINIEILLENTVAVAEHSDIMETIEKELAIMSEYEDKLAVLKKYFMGGWTTGKKEKEVING